MFSIFGRVITGFDVGPESRFELGPRFAIPQLTARRQTHVTGTFAASLIDHFAERRQHLSFGLGIRFEITFTGRTGS